MAIVTFKGTPCATSGELPAIGKQAPAFALTGGDLSEMTLADFAGNIVVLNIVPSLDTEVCALSAKRFNAEANALPGVVILNVSADLPFAQKRFCDAEGLSAVRHASTFRSPAFGKAYGVTLAEGPLAGLTARAVVVVDRRGAVAYTELVPEIAQEPDYAAAIEAVRALG